MAEYTLRTIKDILDKVPADRIETCMKELTVLLTTSKATSELMRAVMSDVAGREVPPLHAFPDEIVWRDDGEGDIQVNLPIGDQKLCVKMKMAG